MTDFREGSCGEGIKKELTKFFVILTLLMSGGMLFMYFKLKTKIYHTSFVGQEITKQIYGVNIEYDKSKRKFEVIVVNPDKALINEIIKRK